MSKGENVKDYKNKKIKKICEHKEELQPFNTKKELHLSQSL